MNIDIIQTLYGYLVVVGEWRFSFFKKENSEAFVGGPYAGPHHTDPRKLWSAQMQAKRALLAAGHTVVV